jgi:hypothetical protein
LIASVAGCEQHPIRGREWEIELTVTGAGPSHMIFSDDGHLELPYCAPGCPEAWAAPAQLQEVDLILARMREQGELARFRWPSNFWPTSWSRPSDCADCSSYSVTVIDRGHAYAIDKDESALSGRLFELLIDVHRARARNK